ncbi:MAG: hypothetical protein DRR42_16425 [Gammaproteobacteria bacterium]|nr:MAG: hypothetical protein DRR42_16425 [Gammaproteobacteria bacterium]
MRKVRLGVEKTEIPGALAYFTALASESDSISDKPIPDQVLELLDKRLSNLRKCAEKDLLEQYRLFKHGQDLIKMCDVSLREIEQRIELGSGKRTLIDNVFTPGDKGLSRLLCYYKGAHGGCRPGEGYEVNGRWLGKELGEIEREYGGAESVLRWLGHGRRLLTCVSVITMVDQALNVESARTLKRDCLGPVESGMRRFRWTKCRSGKKSKDQSEMFPVKDGLHEVSLVKAVQIALECTESLAAKAGAEGARFKNYLLLSNSGTTRNSYTSEDVRLGANDTFLNQIRKFASEHEELAGFADELTQDQIRPSVLLHVALQTQSIIAVQRKGKHRSSKTSFLYAHKLPTQIAGNANIQSFMQHLQVLSSWNIEGMAEKTGIPKDRFDALRASLSDVGLGVFCQDPKAGEQASQGYGEGEMCGAIDKCPGCPKRSDYIFATPENIANLICWKDHLEKERDIRMAENPDRWLSIWEPWVVFVEVALEKLSASRQFMKIYKSGEVLAASSNASYPECT